MFLSGDSLHKVVVGFLSFSCRWKSFASNCYLTQKPYHFYFSLVLVLCGLSVILLGLLFHKKYIFHPTGQKISSFQLIFCLFSSSFDIASVFQCPCNSLTYYSITYKVGTNLWITYWFLIAQNSHLLKFSPLWSLSFAIDIR